MERLEINKICSTYEEEKELKKELSNKYIVAVFENYPQELWKGGQSTYGVKSILHFGKR